MWQRERILKLSIAIGQDIPDATDIPLKCAMLLVFAPLLVLERIVIRTGVRFNTIETSNRQRNGQTNKHNILKRITYINVSKKIWHVNAQKLAFRRPFESPQQMEKPRMLKKLYVICLFWQQLLAK